MPRDPVISIHEFVRNWVGSEKSRRQGAGDRETRAAQHGDPQQGGDHAPWAQAVERAPEWQLHGSKAEEIRASQQAQVGRAQAEFGAERRRQCRRHRAQHGSKEVGEGEREEELRRADPGHGLTGWRAAK